MDSKPLKGKVWRLGREKHLLMEEADFSMTPVRLIKTEQRGTANLYLAERLHTALTTPRNSLDNT